LSELIFYMKSFKDALFGTDKARNKNFIELELSKLGLYVKNLDQLRKDFAKKLLQLEVLNLSYDSIQDLVNMFQDLPALKSLNLINNPIITLSKEVLNASTFEVLIESRIKEEAAKFNNILALVKRTKNTSPVGDASFIRIV